MEYIGEDFEGWPMYKKNVKDILLELGAQTYIDANGNEIIGFLGTSPTLSLYPITLEDDGMGYGVRDCWIVAAENHKNKRIHLWREPVTK